MKHLKTKIRPEAQITECLIGENLLANLDQIKALKNKNYAAFLVLSDTAVFNLYGKKVISALKRLRKPVTTSLIKPGEGQKNLSTVGQIVKSFLKNGLNKNACLVALGGGVITDLGGFAASIFLRGIDSVFLPTTLLGQIDAGLGGKTGVNLDLTESLMAKNMLGTIVQPKLVISDVDTSLTLPKNEILNGLGEMAKYWVGWGKPAISQLKSVASTPGVERRELAEIISICQKIKLDLVQKDPLDTKGIRQKLNLGHTIGHAVEGAANGKISHGQAVAIGLAAAAKISTLKGFLPKETCKMIVSLLKALGLPTETKNVNRQKVLQNLKLDKKGGTFVLIKDIGKLITGVKVEKEIISKVLSEVVI